MLRTNSTEGLGSESDGNRRCRRHGSDICTHGARRSVPEAAAGDGGVVAVLRAPGQDRRQGRRAAAAVKF